MSISSELRKYVADKEAFYITSYAAKCLLGIADRIDAAVDDMVELPKDADNVPWHIGDRDEDGNTVTAIKLGLDGFWIRVGCTYRIAKQARHYQPDTWEKIIEDALDADVDDFACMRDALVARCKALAGDTE